MTINYIIGQVCAVCFIGLVAGAFVIFAVDCACSVWRAFRR